METKNPKEKKNITINDITIDPTGKRTTSNDFKSNYTTAYTGEGQSGFQYNEEVTDNYPYINRNRAGFDVDKFRNEYALNEIFNGSANKESDFKYNYGLDNETDSPLTEGEHNTLSNSFKFFNEDGRVLSVREMTETGK